jgi:hypothetical protein
MFYAFVTCSVLFCSALLLYSTLLYSTLLYSTLLYSTLLYSTLLYSTLHRIKRHYEEQCGNLIRKLMDGYNPFERDLKEESNADGDEDSKGIRIDVSSIHGIKDDLKYLKQASELRGMRDDKQMRRKLVRMARKENAKMVEEEQRSKAELLARRMAKLKINSGAGKDPQPSVYALASHLHRNLTLLPNHKCQVCKKKLLPSEPSKLASISPKKPKYPIMAHCGHWLHYKCIDEHLTTPPFVKNCAVCGDRISHTNWTSDIAKLEKRWAQEQAKKRELTEIASMMGFE